MQKNGRKRVTDQERAGSRGVELSRPLFEWVAAVGLESAIALLEREREELCGVRYRHDCQRSATRGGHVRSSLVFGGRRVVVSRPRVRSRDGHELALRSWQVWSRRDPLDREALKRMLIGPATMRARWNSCPRRFLSLPPDATRLAGVSLHTPSTS